MVANFQKQLKMGTVQETPTKQQMAKSSSLPQIKYVKENDRND